MTGKVCTRFAKWLTFLFGCAAPSVAAGQPAQAPQTGYQANRPLVAAACPTCPWGAVADVLDRILVSRGYDVEVCYHCSGVPNPRLVSRALRPTPRRTDQMALPQAPDAPLDFGITNVHRLHWAFAGLHDYRGEAMPNLRAIALVEHPMYVGIAVRADSFITDLRQIRERRLPARIIARDDPMVGAILEYYGLSRSALESWGGRLLRGEPEDRDNFDVIIQNQLYLANTPEANIWYEISQSHRLRFLPMPPDLRASLVRDLDMRPAEIPAGLLRGIDAPVPTVARSGQVVYARADAPDAFAYAVARAMDEERAQFAWTNMNLSYNPLTAPRALGVPLHPGAARYYRERGYIR